MPSLEPWRRTPRWLWRCSALIAVCWSGLVVSWPRVSSAQAAPPASERETERKRLLDQLGLKKRPPGAAAPKAEADQKRDADKESSAGDTAPAQGSKGPVTEQAASAAKAEASPEIVFAGAVHQVLLAACRSCHGTGGTAARSKYVLDGMLDADFAATRGQVNTGQPVQSALLRRAAGLGHAGGAIFLPGSVNERLLLRWISDGARRGTGGPGPAVVAVPDAPKAAAPPTPPLGAALVPTPPVAPVTADPAPVAPSSVAELAYAPSVHEALNRGCASCHRSGSTASNSGFVLNGDAAADFASARRLVDLGQPEASLLLRKASGSAHAGGAVFPPEGADYRLVLAWIASGASGPTAPTPAPAIASVGAAAATVQVVGPVAPAVDGSGGIPHGTGLRLPLALRLNGRFDLNYERRNFDTQPFSAGDNALRSYHHFLFLSRQSEEDPVGFSAEVIDLTFWEVNYHLSLPESAGQIWIKAGKLLVPFGSDPLFHQSYGGLVGFDQRVLPPIWAQEGVSGRFWRAEGPLSGSVDLYAVRGYVLKQADAVLNLQNDFSPVDSAQLGFGFRLRGSWHALSASYSGYLNGLDFGRTLYLQAVDVGLWRLRGVPVLEHLAAELGLLRADISGAGAGQDYYHFASYFRVRYFLTDRMHVQYRQGLWTFDNRRGVILDDTRLTREDGSTHNFGFVLRQGPFTFGLYYFFVLEKVDEVPNDFLRVAGVYEF